MSPQASEMTDRQRWLALYALCAGALMIVIDGTIVNVALPSIQDDLHFSQSSLAWVINAYMIAFGGLLLLAGRVGDLIGQRKVFLYGVALFTAASALCATAQTQEWLIAARFIQGIGGALSTAVVLGMIVTMFNEPREQAKALGTYGFIASAGGSIGLVAGGIITQAISWHWIFFINLPIGIATIYAARALVPDKPGIGFGEGADVPGAVLLTTGVMLSAYAILQVDTKGWGSPVVLGLLAVGIALVTVFVRRQARIPNPLMPLRLFESRNVSGSNIVIALLVVGMFGMFFLGALYLQRVLKYDALEVGLAFLPSTVVMGTMSLRFSDKIALRFGPRNALVGSLVFMLLGLLWFTQTPVDGNYLTDVMPAMILIGFGSGLGFPALMSLAMSGVEMQDSGIASGLVNCSVQVGGAIGLAVLATLSSERHDTLIGRGVKEAAALNSGYHVAYWIGAGVVATAIVMALLILRSPQGAPAHDGGGHGAGAPDAMADVA